MIYGGGAFRRQLGHEGHLEQACCPYNKRTESYLTLFNPGKTQCEVSHLQPGRGLAPEPDHDGNVSLDFQLPELRNKILLLINHQAYDILI